MAQYWTPAALKRLAQSESSGRADLVHYPSGYTKSGTKSSASGLYGYLDSTWKTYAPQAGVDTTQYPRAYMAPADVQTRVAAVTPISNWTCPGCNPTASRLARNSNYVSDTPTSAPLTSGDSGDGISFDAPAPQTTGGSADSETGDYGGGGSLPDVIQQGAGQVADGTASGSSPGGGLPSIATWGWDKLVRAFLILLGIVVVAIAAWGVVEGEFNPSKALRRITQ